ncbi:MAG TPA: PAS domain S-box protein [Albitalea sp.]|nr:PAS domain S-box protein [Albitalea sp.]
MSARPAPPAAPAVTGSELFRVLVEGARDYAIFMLDPNGIVVSWNAGAQRINGYAAEEIIGQHFSKFYPPAALAVGWPEEELRRATAAGRFEDEGWRVRKDGKRFWANVVITPMRGPQGELLGFSKITRDLSERREHEERLRQSEEMLRLLVEGVSDHAMFLLDPEGRVLRWNAGARRVLGHEEEAVIGQPSMIFYTEADVAADKPKNDLAHALATGSCSDAGWRVRADGTRFWADVTISALYETDGTPRGFTQIVRDLTERRRVQELEIEGQRINEFIAMLAHELRNPLAPIRNAVGILDKMATTPELNWCARLIGRQVVHLARLVDDLLDVSRITSGKIQLRKEALDLNAVVAGAIESVRPAVQDKGHELHVSLPEHPVPVIGDPTRLTQVIVNLVTNAAKYTPNGGRIELRLEQHGSQVEIHVIDNGIGMSRQLIATAFDLFVQGDRALDRSEGGLGLGLTLVKRIVLLHGGVVSASSGGPGQGSEFTVCLPSATPAAEPVRSVVRRRILVVDDRGDADGSVASLLAASGHEVLLARDVAQALRLGGEQVPDTVLLDLDLPGMDGHDLARRLRGIPALAHTRLVAMTRPGQPADEEGGPQADFDAHLVKPVDGEALARLIDSDRDHRGPAPGEPA